ncbi:MAG: HAMP domain-containing sensor histidine kinase [Ilumatobacter sp.]
MAVTTAVIVVALVAPLAFVITDRQASNRRQATELTATTLASFIDDRTSPTEIVATIDRLTTDDPGIEVTVYRRDGLVLGADVPVDDVVRASFEPGAPEVTENDGDVVYLPNNGPFEFDEASEYVIRVENVDTVFAESNRRLKVVLAASTILAVALAAIIAAFAARTISDPTRRVTRTARRLQSGDLSARATPEGPREVRELAEALNALARQVEELLVRERESVADLAHRLRTPLTALHLEVETLPDSNEAGELMERVERLERTLSEIINEMRHDRPAEVAPRADLVATIRGRLDDWSQVAGEAGRQIDLAIESQDPRIVAIAPDDLGATFDILINNALAHTPPHTAVTVSVGVSAGGVSLVVDDRGRGFSKSSASALARGASGDGSTGLGLDIARRTVEGASGSIELGQSNFGGARVTLTMPTIDADFAPGPRPTDNR